MNAKMLTTALAAGMFGFGFTTPALADHHMGKGKAKEMMMEKFEDIDTDDSGTVSESEFMDAMEARFEMIDADGDDEVTTEEMEMGMEKMKEKWKSEM